MITIDRSFQLKDGVDHASLQTVCITHAINTFFARKDLDTNPMIVQMKVDGKKVDHWYYRSDQHIEQPYYIAARMIQPVVGGKGDVFPFPGHYGEYEISHSSMDLAKKLTKPLPTDF